MKDSKNKEKGEVLSFNELLAIIKEDNDSVKDIGYAGGYTI